MVLCGQTSSLSWPLGYTKSAEEAFTVLGDATLPMTERARLGRQMLQMTDTPSNISAMLNLPVRLSLVYLRTVLNVMLSGYRKPSLGGRNPERRQLSFRGSLPK